MRLHALSLSVAAAFAAGLSAQCGAFQLTTPPNFTSNNGGAIGGAVYFTLTVTSATGVTTAPCSWCRTRSTTGASRPTRKPTRHSSVAS